jgi:chromosome segregation ATPase
MSTLYQLTGERLALQTKLQEMNLDEDTIHDTLEGEALAIEAKIESYGFVIKNLRAPVIAIDDEIKRLQERKKAFDRQADRVEAWLKDNMVKCGIKKLECPAFTIAIQDNPPSVFVDDEAKIPKEYMRQAIPKIPPPEPDKVAIAKAIKEGKEVAGCHLNQTQRLVIK